MEVVLNQLFLLTVGSKDKNYKHTQYHAILIPFKSQVYTKHGSPIFLIFELWILVPYLHVYISTISLYFVYKTFLLFHTTLLRYFI